MRRDEVQRRFGTVLTSVAANSAARDRDGGALPRTVLREAGALGILGLGLPEEVGGAGLDGQRWGRALEEIGYLCDDMSFSLLVSLMPAVAMAIHETGRRDLTERYVVPMARGERLAAFAWTEDADAFSLSSTVREREGGFVANGRKLYVSGGMLADTFMTYVRDQQDDVRVFLIERDDPGVEVRPLDVAGLRAAGIASLTFTDVHLDAERQLVDADGVGHVQRFLNRRRVMVSCGPAGRMRRLAEECARLLGQTVRYGRALSQMQSVQASLGRMVTKVEAAHLILHAALRHLDEGPFNPVWDTTVSTAKHQIAEAAIEVATTCLRLLGGRAYTRDLPFERSLRDFLGLLAGAGAQEILEADLGMLLASAAHRGAEMETQ